MPNKLAHLLCLAGLIMATQAAPQDPPTAPLSVIDWLDIEAAQPAPALPPTQGVEPGVAASANVPDVRVTPLDESAPRRVGLAPSSVTGLPDTIWSGSNGQTLARKLTDIATQSLPALQSLYYTLLLAEAGPPARHADVFDLARVDALFDLGALDPALALLEQAGPERSPAHFARFLDMTLLAGTEHQACAILRARPDLSPGKAHEVYCAARDGDWSTAALQLGTGRVLGLIDEPTTLALEQFLDPDLFEGEPPLATPRAPSPLLFRLHEAIGTPIPTRSLPVVYANADLSDTAGWKAQIEAAERLSRTGAISDNRLLGLYTQRRPAASGGVWDRVESLQQFETALGTGSSSAVSKTLPAVWRTMGEARLRVHFANLFAQDLSSLTLSGETANIAFDALLLSGEYERAAQVFPLRAQRRPALAAIAAGTAPPDLELTGTAGAVLAAFRDTAADTAIVDLARNDALGAALLAALALTLEGADGDVARLSKGLATLRALGLEDVARRAALQVILLEGTP